LKSTTRFTGTRTFIDPLSLEFWGLVGSQLAWARNLKVPLSAVNARKPKIALFRRPL
jgi:hypothetical protein